MKTPPFFTALLPRQCLPLAFRKGYWRQIQQMYYQRSNRLKPIWLTLKKMSEGRQKKGC